MGNKSRIFALRTFTAKHYEKIYRYLLLILLLSEICPLHSETIPADTLLMRLYERAASLMEKVNLIKPNRLSTVPLPCPKQNNLLYTPSY